MIGRELPARTPDEAARLVRALGSHRYIAGRLLLVHAFVFDAVARADIEDLREARDWAAATLADRSVDRASRDERLWRRATEKELAAALAVLWSTGPDGEAARTALAAHLASIDCLPATGQSASALFDETQEDEVFPVLVDAGWELLSLAALDPERHRGAIDAYGDAFTFECAKFEEASLAEAADGVDAPAHYLQELPVLGAAELLHGAEHDILRAPLVLWTEGSETYHDYVLRGVLRAAKLD
jgi:hypothetical protein